MKIGESMRGDGMNWRDEENTLPKASFNAMQDRSDLHGLATLRMRAVVHDATNVDPNTTTPTAPWMTDRGTLIPHLSLDGGNPTRAAAPTPRHT